jgi:hypothetical protein
VALPAYVGKILDGAKLSELPVVTQIKLRLAINVEIAGTLGVHAPAAALRPHRRGDRATLAYPKMTHAISCNPALPGEPNAFVWT